MISNIILTENNTRKVDRSDDKFLNDAEIPLRFRTDSHTDGHMYWLKVACGV